jgi:hypothetical protein
LGGVGEIERCVVGAGVDVDEEVHAEEDASVAVDFDVDATRVGRLVASVLPQVDVFSQVVVGSDDYDRIGNGWTCE